MFINISGRTDIVNYYSEWLINRITEGFALVRNPYNPVQVSKVSFNSEVVDCLIFCTKNPEPILNKLDFIKSKGLDMFFHITITPYGKDVEKNVPPPPTLIESFKKVSNNLSKNNICWRYDPILLTKKYTPEFHIHTFEEMAKELAPYTNFCIISFISMYKKLAWNFPEILPFPASAKAKILTEFGKIGKKYNLRIQTCGDENNYFDYGIHSSGCITKEILERAINHPLRELKTVSARKGCNCVNSIDIGAYNCCPNGCKYCYANKDYSVALDNFYRHNPNSPLLLGELRTKDVIKLVKQESYKQDFGQIKMDLF